MLGKVYYDLIEARENLRNPKSTIIRVEQFYPFNKEVFQQVVEPYMKAKRVVWCQQEPENMGAWSFLRPYLDEVFGKRLSYVGRTATASPATGSLTLHKLEQADLVAEALNQPKPTRT